MNNPANYIQATDSKGVKHFYPADKVQRIPAVKEKPQDSIPFESTYCNGGDLFANNGNYRHPKYWSAS